MQGIQISVLSQASTSTMSFSVHGSESSQGSKTVGKVQIGTGVPMQGAHSDPSEPMVSISFSVQESPSSQLSIIAQAGSQASVTVISMSSKLVHPFESVTITV